MKGRWEGESSEKTEGRRDKIEGKRGIHHGATEVTERKKMRVLDN